MELQSKKHIFTPFQTWHCRCIRTPKRRWKNVLNQIRDLYGTCTEALVTLTNASENSLSTSQININWFKNSNWPKFGKMNNFQPDFCDDTKSPKVRQPLKYGIWFYDDETIFHAFSKTVPFSTVKSQNFEQFYSFESFLMSNLWIPIKKFPSFFSF